MHKNAGNRMKRSANNNMPPLFRKRNSTGFTLIELVVVMLLISIMLAVAIPRFDTGLIHDPTKKLSRWLIATVKTLRSTAIQKQIQQTLVIDYQNNRMWTASAEMSEEALAAASENAFILPKAIRIIEIDFLHEDREVSSPVSVNFYPAGFSDNVLIRLESDRTDRFSYLIEPLLPKVKFFEEWISF